MDQPRGHIAAIGAVDRLQGVVTLLQFKQAPFRGGAIQVGHALADERGTAMRDEKMKSFDQKFSCGGLAAGFEPENAKGQGGIDGGLRFGGIHSEYGEGALAVAQDSTGVDGAKGFFQVDGGGETGDGEFREMAVERAAQFLFITYPGGLFRGGRAAVAFAANFKPGRARLSEALHSKFQHAILHFGIEHAAHGVALGRPKVQQAFVVIARDRVFGLAQVEGDGAVFEHDSARGFAEKVLRRSG